MQWFNRSNGRRDYTKEDQPTTRRELAKLVLRDHFFSLIPMNLILLLVSLPAIFWTLSSLVYIATELQGGGTLWDFLSLSRTWLAILFPCLAFTGPFALAMYKVLRNLARDDFRHPKQTFLDALRGEWKPALLLSAITGLFPLLIWAAVCFYLPMVQTSGELLYIPIFFTVVLALMWILTLPTLAIMLVTYELPFIQQVKNALLLTISRLPLILGIHLLAVLPLLLGIAALMIGGFFLNVVMFLLCVYYILFGFALAALLYAFVANKLCEEIINPHIPGADTHIGMRR